MGTWSTCTWGFHSHFFPGRHDHSPRTQPVFGGARAAWNKSQKSGKSLIVRTAGLFAWNHTSFALCYYVIGLFNRVQTNRKHKRKRMWLGCEQFLWREHCVTSQKTAAEETKVWCAAKTWRREVKFFLVTICQCRQNDSQSEEINVIGESPADREQARACAGSW